MIAPSPDMPAPLLAITLPRAIKVDPRLASSSEAAPVYQEVSDRLRAFARSAGDQLPLISVITAALYLDDRLRWISARLASGNAIQGEFQLAAAILEAASQIMAIFERWLVIGGGNPQELDALKASGAQLAGILQGSAQSAPAAAATNALSATASQSLAPVAPAHTSQTSGGSSVLVVLVILAVFMAMRK